MRMPVSIKTIAEECGVSRQAVSNALTDKGRLAPETRERIVQVARELGYRPNSIARTMQSGRFGSIALLLSTKDGHSWMPDPLLAGIHDELARHDLHLTVARLPDEKLVSAGLVPKLLREWACDGVLINYIYEVPSRLVSMIEEYNIPCIWINMRREADCVHPDDFQAAYDATRHLLDLGHRNIGFVDYRFGSAAQHYSIHDRRGGYETALHEAGCQTHVIGNTSARPMEELFDLSVAWLGQPNRPTAVVAYGDAEAVAITTAAMSLGLRLPHDLSLIAFHWGGVAITCLGTTLMAMPAYQMGETAVQMLLRKIDDPSLVLPPQALPYGSMAGHTVGPT